MVHLKLWQDNAGRLCAFEANGHSGYAEEGSDIVCAAVSVLAITCINAVETICGTPMLVKGGENGYLSARLSDKLTTEHERDAQTLLRALRLGWESLAEEYPRYVHFSTMNGGKSP